MAALNQQPKLEPVRVSREFNASPELVFQAWSSAEAVKQWFCPDGFSVPQARVEFKPGGVFEVCMRSPQGQDHWSRGHFVEIVPHRRLVLDLKALDAKDEPLFRAYTEVDFVAAAIGTRLEVTQTYTLYVPMAAAMIGGAPLGWAQTLNKLHKFMLASAPPHSRSVAHGSFTVQRKFNASRAQVFGALTDLEAKEKWFAGGPGYQVVARSMDVRPGGRERLEGRWDSGSTTCFDAVYFDVIAPERIVYSYEMHVDGRKISVSLAVFELKAEEGGTRLTLTEHGAFLDGYDDAGSRERGTNFLMDALGRSLN